MLRCVVRGFNQLNIINAKYKNDGGAFSALCIRELSCMMNVYNCYCCCK